MESETDRRTRLREQARAKIAVCKTKLREMAASSGWTEVMLGGASDDYQISLQRIEKGPIVRVQFNTKSDYLGYTDGCISATVACGVYGRAVTYQESKPIGNINLDKVVDRIRQNLEILEAQQERADKRLSLASQREEQRREMLKQAPLRLLADPDGFALSHDDDGTFKITLSGLSDKDVLAAFACLADFGRMPC